MDTAPATQHRDAPSPEARELEAFWDAFRGGSASARERLILHYAPLVKYVASRLGAGLPQTVEHGDLVSNGMFGLMDALERFDAGRQVKFETFAMPRIRGAILDELRAMDWVPRSIRFKARELERATADLEGRLRRAPSDDEIAEHLGTTREELHQVLTQISFVSVMALDEVAGSDEHGQPRSLLDTLADVASGGPTDDLEGQEMRVMLGQAVNGLSEREKLVVTLYYFEGLTLSEIGEILGVTESRVCQIHTKAVFGLRASLSDID